MLDDVRVTIKDGGLGVLPRTASYVHAKIGVATKTPSGVLRISDRDSVPELLGRGPLVNALFDSFGAGARQMLAVVADADIAGEIGDITKDIEGDGDLTAAGTPNDSYDVMIQITDSGALNEAGFRYSLDGGYNWSPKVTVPQEGDYELPDTGVTVTFVPDDDTPPDSFLEGDEYRFKTVAPKASVNSVMSAVTELFNLKGAGYEFIHIVGESDVAMWTALDTRAKEAETDFRFIHFTTETRGKSDGETVDDWVNDLLDERTGFASTRVSPCAAWGEIVDVNTGLVVLRNGAGIFAGRVSSIPVQASPGEVARGALQGIMGIKPDGINDAHIAALDEAGYTTFRQYIDLDGIYVTNGRMMAEQISDYQYTENRRVMDKACRLVRITALRFQHGEGTAAGLDALEERLNDPVRQMRGAGEITGGRVTIPRDQNIVAGATLRAKIRLRPVGIIRGMELEIGFENPFQVQASRSE